MQNRITKIDCIVSWFMIARLKCHLIRPARWHHDIFDIDIPLCQKEVDAERVLCAVNLDTPIPADFRTFLHHLDMVSLLAGPWGLTWLRSIWQQSLWRTWVFFVYSCKCLITHNFFLILWVCQKLSRFEVGTHTTLLNFLSNNKGTFEVWKLHNFDWKEFDCLTPLSTQKG